ncbi:hypothetical protein AB0D34_07320 [Streptomyces sp. NPDC048420]|uniref:hypothetical protein n=1 Tax=Streptomyces sp. NPDC048420 TaxID=3155755 RepID=UPI0034124948
MFEGVDRDVGVLATVLGHGLHTAACSAGDHHYQLFDGELEPGTDDLAETVRTVGCHRRDRLTGLTGLTTLPAPSSRAP